LFEVLRDGQTPGKRIMRLRVINANGTPVTWIGSIVRNLMRTVDMLPLCYGFGLVACLVDPSSRRLGDMVAGTLVVHAEALAQQSAAPNVPIVQPPIALPPAGRAAIIEFAERAAQLTPERQQELAALLPMLTQTSGALSVQRLHGMASAFLGRR
jgi:RDD family